MVAGGCAGRPTTPVEDDPVVEAPANAAAPEGEGTIAHREKGAAQLLMRAALEDLDLSAAQRTAIAAALEDLGARPDAMPGKAVFSKLAAGVREGKIDDAAIAAELDALHRAAQDHRAKAVTALQKLHDTLTSEQRGALVASVEKRAAEHAQDKGEHEGKRGKTWDGKKSGGAPAARILRGVDLTDAQRARVEQALANAGIERRGKDSKASHADKRAQRQALLQAFVTERFDAAALLPERQPDARLSGLVKTVQAILPVLDQTQRAQLAENLEKGPAHAGGKHGGKHGPGGKRDRKGG